MGLDYCPSLSFSIYVHGLLYALCISGTKVCEKLQDLVSSRQMKKDIPKLSTGPQTAV
jgi:hypothetical protein